MFVRLGLGEATARSLYGARISHGGGVRSDVGGKGGEFVQ